MTINTVAVVAPGDMGHALAMRLHKDGNLRVITNLDGRSGRSKTLAAAAGLEDVGDDRRLVEQADAFLSVVPPGRAILVARRFAKAIKAAGKNLLYADLNAISPTTAHRIDALVTGAGGRFIDGGIVGGAPVDGAALPRILLSGPAADELLPLNDKGLAFFKIGDRPGQASALKICFASISKGLMGLGVLAFVSARVMGVDEALRKEMERGNLMPGFLKRFPDVGPNAYRWAEEMDQIAETFAKAGMTPKVFAGMADLYRFVESTPLGKETPENVVLGATMDKVVAGLAEAARTRQPKVRRPVKKTSAKRTSKAKTSATHKAPRKGRRKTKR